jgi:hypothetical protein
MILSRYVFSGSTDNAKVSLVGQKKSGPGFPFIVWESELFGATPELIAWLITDSVSAFHHSPIVKATSLSGLGKGYGTPFLGRMTMGPYNVARNQRM